MGNGIEMSNYTKHCIVAYSRFRLELAIAGILVSLLYDSDLVIRSDKEITHAKQV